MILWGFVLAIGVFWCFWLPESRPVLAASAWVLLAMPGLALAGMMPHYARQFEVPGQWNRHAWQARAVGLGMVLLVFAMWLQMVDRASNDATIIGIVTLIVQVATLVPLAFALIAGNRDQIEENEQMAAEYLHQLRQQPRRSVWSGDS